MLKVQEIKNICQHQRELFKGVVNHGAFVEMFAKDKAKPCESIAADFFPLQSRGYRLNAAVQLSTKSHGKLTPSENQLNRVQIAFSGKRCLIICPRVRMSLRTSFTWLSTPSKR